MHEILPAGFLRDTEAMFMGGIEEAIEGNVATVLQEKLNHEHRRIFRGLSRAHKKIQKSRDPRTREQAIRTFINQYIPDTQGGGPALTNTQKRILQRIYKEMQSCIKYVRYMTKWRIGEDLETKEIKEFVLEDIPEIDIIFTKDELPMLFEETSVATTAAKIILKRLQKFSPRFNITSRRFQDILTGISPL